MIVALLVVIGPYALAQQPDFGKVEIKVSKVAGTVYMLQGQGGSAVCGAPFRYIFVGYDGNYYLCGSDWKRQVPLGTVKTRLELGLKKIYDGRKSAPR